MEGNAEYAQADTDDQEINERRKNSRFHFRNFPCSKELRDNDCASVSPADGYGYEYVGNRVGSAHRSQCLFSHKLTDNHRVCNIIKLLEQIPQNHGDGEKQKRPPRMISQHVISFLSRFHNASLPSYFLPFPPYMLNRNRSTNM